MQPPKGECLLNHYLELNKISQSELARRSGIPQRTISDYASNKRQMTVSVARAIAKVFNIQIEDLYKWEN